MIFKILNCKIGLDLLKAKIHEAKCLIENISEMQDITLSKSI